MACGSSLRVVVPSLNFNLGLDAGALRFLNLVFGDLTKRYHAPADKIVLGGFSLGGMNALRYTQLAYKKTGQTAIMHKAVYAIDPPLDWPGCTVRLHAPWQGIFQHRPFRRPRPTCRC